MRIICIIILAAFAGHAFGGDKELGIKSAILPGMGQLSAGGGEIKSINTLKGLGIMAGFAICLHNTFQSISRQESYAEQTKTLKDQESKAEFYEDRIAIKAQWQDAYDNYESEQISGFIFLGLTAAFYGYGIVDAYLFTKKESRQEGAGYLAPGQKTNVAVFRKDGRTGLEIRHLF